MMNRDWLRLGAFRTVLSQFVAIALLWRPALPIPHASCRFVLQECVSSKLWPSVRLELWQMRGILPLLIADVGAPNCEIVLSQDFAGPNVEACPTGAFCLGYATPPIDQVESILSRREVCGRRHLGLDALPVELRPAPTTAKSETPEVEARWPSDRPRYKPGTYDEVAQAEPQSCQAFGRPCTAQLCRPHGLPMQSIGSLSLHDGGALRFISMSERCAQPRVG